MNKTLFVGALTLVAAVSQAQTIIYDTITGNTGVTTTGGLPRNRMADSFSTSAAPSGQQWRIDKIEVALWVGAAATYTGTTGQVKVWNTWNSAAVGAVFSNSVSDVTWNTGDLTTTGVAAFIFTFDYAAAGLSFIGDGTDMGIEVQWKVNGAKDDRLATGLRDVAPLVGSSSNLFYRDANNNEIIEDTDGRTIGGWTNSNAMVRITGQAVPEPATMAALGLGIAAIAARRRRRS